MNKYPSVVHGDRYVGSRRVHFQFRGRVGHGGRGKRHALGLSPKDEYGDVIVLPIRIVKLVEIVGEAAKQVSDDAREEYPQVPWSNAARMRDRLIHHYFDINLDILWATVSEELPPLALALGDIVEA